MRQGTQLEKYISQDDLNQNEFVGSVLYGSQNLWEGWRTRKWNKNNSDKILSIQTHRTTSQWSFTISPILQYHHGALDSIATLLAKGDDDSENEPSTFSFLKSLQKQNSSMVHQLPKPSSLALAARLQRKYDLFFIETSSFCHLYFFIEHRNVSNQKGT